MLLAVLAIKVRIPKHVAFALARGVAYLGIRAELAANTFNGKLKSGHWGHITKQLQNWLQPTRPQDGSDITLSTQCSWSSIYSSISQAGWAVSWKGANTWTVCGCLRMELRNTALHCLWMCKHAGTVCGTLIQDEICYLFRSCNYR